MSKVITLNVYATINNEKHCSTECEWLKAIPETAVLRKWERAKLGGICKLFDKILKKDAKQNIKRLKECKQAEPEDSYPA